MVGTASVRRRVVIRRGCDPAELSAILGQRIDPEQAFSGDAESYRSFRDCLGILGLREIGSRTRRWMHSIRSAIHFAAAVLTKKPPNLSVIQHTCEVQCERSHRKGGPMVGAFVGVLLLLLGIGAVAGVVVAVAMGLPTLAIAIGLISGAFFAGRAV
ncbi:hypothetical protein [Mycolicibacterium goodii]|nr:hypothetical protein [Mycolicibacterium goodii]MBU8817809.1 hypothetical protein [Mycolicibacterium goodii]MBU8830524.1 hypothetical protein [Mycolicibacterium goodii]